MKTTPLLMLLLVVLLASCNTVPGQNASSLTLSYDDFGPERIAARLLGPRGPNTVVIAHYGFTKVTPAGSEDVRYINVLQGMNFLRDEVRALPNTAANEGLRQRLRGTYARLYPMQLRRYNAALGGSFTMPTVGMSRRLMLPALPPPQI